MFFQSPFDVLAPVCLIVVVSRDEKVDVALAPGHNPIDAAKTLVTKTCISKLNGPTNDILFFTLMWGQHHFPGDQFFARFCAQDGHGSELIEVGGLLFVTAERLKCYMDACKHTRRGMAQDVASHMYIHIFVRATTNKSIIIK